MIVQLIDFLRNRLQLVTYFFFIGIAGIAVWSLRVDLHHAHTWAEQHIPVFWGLFALISATLIIMFSRWWGRGGIKAREDYYDN